MSYVDRHLAQGEQVVFRTRFHPVVLGSTALFAAFVVGVTVLIVARNELAAETVGLLWLAAAVIAVAALTPPWVRWRTSEFAVTDRRVVAKVGVVRVHALELPLARAEIEVEPTFAGRLFGYGTLEIREGGGTGEAFPRVSRPDALREALARQRHASPVARAR
jgi:uncharacterized membrane protein YdbT with pleckstrin-like domain